MFNREKSIKNYNEITRTELRNTLGHPGHKEKRDKASYLSDFKILDTLGVKKFNGYPEFEPIYNGSSHYKLDYNNYIYFQPPVDKEWKWPQSYSLDSQHGYMQIIDNQHAFNEIENIDDILVKMTKIMNASVDTHHLINPESGFLLKLSDGVVKDYEGKAELFIIDNNTPESVVKNPDKLQEMKKFNENAFLDKFIGLNYGVNVRRNKELRDELNKFNDKLISTGRRKKINMNFDKNTEQGRILWEIPNKVEKYSFPGERR